MNYSTYVVEDTKSGEWLHVGKQRGTGRTEPLIQAIKGDYPTRIHNKAWLMFLYSKNRNLHVKVMKAFDNDNDAKSLEKKLKTDTRASRAYGINTNYYLSLKELEKFYGDNVPELDPATALFIKQATVHGDIFSNSRTPYNIVPEGFKCLFKI